MKDLNNLPIGTEVIFVTNYPWTEYIGKVTAQSRSVIINGKTVCELIINEKFSTFKNGANGDGCSILSLAN